MINHNCWKFAVLIWSTIFVSRTASETIAVVDENVKDKFLFSQEITLPDLSCNVTRIDYDNLDGVVIRWTAPYREDGGSYRVNVTLVEALDFEHVMKTKDKPNLYMQLRATFVCDSGGEQQKTLPKLTLLLKDVKDWTPQFQMGRYEATVPENQAINTIIVYNITAIDEDSDDQVAYTIETSDNERNMFEGIVTVKYIEGKNRHVLDISLAQPLDYEKATVHSFTVTATDTVNSSSTCDVIIRVKDVQDTPPSFTLPVYSGRVNEAAPTGTSVATVSAVDGDSTSIRNEVVYSIIEGSEGVFEINNSTGVISTQGQLEVDGNNPIGTNGLVILTVQAEETNSSLEIQYGNTTARTQVQIQIEDANDNPPVFSSPTFSGSIRSDAVAGEIVSIDGGGYISVTDQDLAPNNARFRLHIEKDGSPWSVFETNIQSQFVQASILIVLKEPTALQELQNSHLKFQLVATDFSSTPKTNTSSLASSTAEMVVFVLPGTTSAPPPEAIVDLPISESDVIVFIMGFLLLLNIILTLALCRLMRRNSSGGGSSLFRRNSKYYVSERKRTDSGGVVRVTSNQNESNGLGRKTVGDENVEVLNETKATIVPHLATQEGKALALTDSAINRNTQIRNTVSSAANRNRCDVTNLNEFENGKDNETNFRKTGNDASNTARKTQSHQCDVAPLNQDKTDNQPSQGDQTTKDSSNFKNGPSTNKCDVIPLDTSISSKSKALSNLLSRVHQKLAPGSKIGKSDTCDLRPLREDNNSSLDSSVNNSTNSSFSDKTKYGVTPLNDDKSSQEVKDACTPVSPSHVNPAFTSDETETETMRLSNSNRGSDVPPDSTLKNQNIAIPSSIKQSQQNKLQEQQQQQQRPKKPAPQSLVPTLSPSQTQITQMGVPPVALALPLGTNTRPRPNEDKTTNAVTVNNPVYKEDGKGRTTTVVDFSIPNQNEMISSDDNEKDKNRVASIKEKEQSPHGSRGDANIDDDKTITGKGIKRNSSSSSAASKSGQGDSKQPRVDYVQAAKLLLNSSMERVNSMNDKGDKKTSF